jgi:hypothetical protein
MNWSDSIFKKNWFLVTQISLGWEPLLQFSNWLSQNVILVGFHCENWFKNQRSKWEPFNIGLDPFWIFEPSTRPVVHSTSWWEPQIKKFLNLDPSPILTMPNLNIGFTNSISITVGWRCFRICKNNVATRDWCFTLRICLSLYLRERERERERLVCRQNHVQLQSS